jgi:hypothetical protein
MALIMYLTKAPNYQDIITDEYITIPREDIELIDKYFTWGMVRSEGGNAGNTLEEWCGIPASKLPHKYIINHYREFFTMKKFYHEYIGDTKGCTIFDQLARIVKANQIFRWFIENVMDGKPDRQYHEVSARQLFDLLFACKVVRKGFKLIEHDEHYGDKYSVNETVARKYLPLLEEQGYFFGSKDYDINYAAHVLEMIDIIENILKTTDFKKETVYFNATW